MLNVVVLNVIMNKLKSALAFFDIDISGSCSYDEKVVEQFVDFVSDFSSQYGSDISVSYSALNLRGKPSNFPGYGDFPQACVMRTYGKWWDQAPSVSKDYQPQNNGPYPSQDFIDAHFEKSVYPTGIRIYETYNPGAVVRISAKSDIGWSILWEGEPQNVGHLPRMFEPKIRQVKFKTCLLRIELNQSHLQYYTQLDAVLLIGTTKLKKNDDLMFKKSMDDLIIDKPNSQYEPQDIASKVLASGIHGDLIMNKEYTELILDDLNRFLATQCSGMGYFHPLPDETILKIFSFLDLKSLSRCAQVNKAFNRLAQDPLLYRSVNMKPYWYCYNKNVFIILSKRGKLLQKLDLSWCGGQEPIDPKYLSICGHNLTHLRLNNCSFIDYIGLKYISEYCPNLKELSLRGCVNILNVGFVFLSDLRNLTRLDLYRTTIEKHAIIAIARSNKHLQHLNLGSCIYIHSMDEVATEIAKNCSELISIDLWKMYSLTPAGVRAFATNCRNLQEVDFGWCSQLGSSGEWLSELTQSCPNLKKLFLGALRALSEKDLQPIITNCQNLEQLDLLGVRAVTDDICELILEQCTNLKLLDVSFCDLISQQQVELWKHLFPNVCITRTFVPESECSFQWHM